jgi:hypothetical protein
MNEIPILLVAHKGLHMNNDKENIYNLAEANTLEAFTDLTCFESMVSECDLRLTKDNKLLVWHDADITMEEDYEKQHEIRQCTAEECCAIKLCRRGKICTLETLLMEMCKMNKTPNVLSYGLLLDCKLDNLNEEEKISFTNALKELLNVPEYHNIVIGILADDEQFLQYWKNYNFQTFLLDPGPNVDEGKFGQKHGAYLGVNLSDMQNSVFLTRLKTLCNHCPVGIYAKDNTYDEVKFYQICQKNEIRLQYLNSDFKNIQMCCGCKGLSLCD